MPRLKTFSWKDCGSASDPAHIESADASPDPIKFPGKILLFMNTNKISFSFLSKKTGNLTISTKFTITGGQATDLAVCIFIWLKNLFLFIIFLVGTHNGKESCRFLRQSSMC